MGLFTAPKEQGMQLLIRDDGDLEFRKLDIEDSFLCEKNGQGEVTRAWLMPFKLLRRFDGLKGVCNAGRITVSFSRDIVYDPYGQLNPGEKPKKGDDLKKEFVRKIAESKCYQHEKSHKNSFLTDKIVLFLGSVCILLGLAIGIQQAVN